MTSLEKPSTLENIIISTITMVPVAAIGFASSFLDPMFIPKVVKKTYKMKEKSFLYYTMSATAIASYVFGIDLIATNIIENPNQPLNYIPLAANIIGGIYINKHTS